MMTTQLRQIAAGLRIAVFDVDGVMTDGGVTYGHADTEFKTFNIKDGLGIKLLQRGGVDVAIITGRVSGMVERRVKELGISTLIQGREDKLAALKELISGDNWELSQCAYMGDDLPDLAAVQSVGLGACPADAVAELRDSAAWVGRLNGGDGVVREFCEFILRARGQWDSLVDEFLI